MDGSPSALSPDTLAISPGIVPAKTSLQPGAHSFARTYAPSGHVS
jgi:hypothetical protein